MINEELKARFLAGECTEEELIALRDILKNSPEEKQKLFKEEKLSDEFKAQFMPRTQLMLAEQRMQAKIREMKAEQQAEHHAHIIGMWRRAAAIAVVCVLGGLAWFYLQHNPISNMPTMIRRLLYLMELRSGSTNLLPSNIRKSLMVPTVR